MLIKVDSREKPQAVKNILAYFDRHGIEWEKVKLDTGDYMLDGHPELVVDRKQSLGELAHNLLSQDKARFYREVRRARESGIKLIILCEHGGIQSIKDVKSWVPKYGQVSGRALADAIFRLEISYGVPVLYCDKRSTGRRIVEILTGGVKDDKQTIYGRPDPAERNSP
jgi:ERCC4-type nuclease